MSFDFAGRTAIVTGDVGGLGKDRHPREQRRRRIGTRGPTARGHLACGSYGDEGQRALVERIALKRLGTSEDMGGRIASVASGRAELQGCSFSSYIGLTSQMPSQFGQSRRCSSMNFRASSIASAFDFNSMMVKPPITSFDSANGPSVTVSLPFLMLTAAASELCRRPPIETILPALAAASPRRPISSIRPFGGGPEAEKFSSALMIIM